VRLARKLLGMFSGICFGLLIIGIYLLCGETRMGLACVLITVAFLMMMCSFIEGYMARMQSDKNV